MQSAAQLHSLPYTRPAGEFSVPLKMALRTVTLVMLLVMGSMWVVGLPHLYEGTTTPCEPDCTSNQLRSEDIAALE
jgi:hypothetical protein